MNVLVVDTSAWISYFRGSPQLDLESALKEGRVFLPPIVVSELLSVKIKSKERKLLVGLLEELPLCHSDFSHWVRVGELRLKLLGRGISISTPDTHIAQCALDLEGYLLTEDSIFRKVAKTVALKLL